MTSSPTPPRFVARTPAQLAAEPFERWRYEPEWMIARRRRERADAITSYHRHLARRARQARRALLMAGYHLGPAPYGYRTRPVTDPATGAPRQRLVPDPATAHVVALIFWSRVTGHASYTELARRLKRLPVSCPAPVHARTGRRLPWTAARVRAILANPRYTGRQVLPPRPASRHDDAGWPAWSAEPRRWVASPPAHPALISDEMFHTAQQLAGPSAPLWLYGDPPADEPPTEPAGTGPTHPGTAGGDEWPASA